MGCSFPQDISTYNSMVPCTDSITDISMGHAAIPAPPWSLQRLWGELCSSTWSTSPPLLLTSFCLVLFLHNEQIISLVSFNDFMINWDKKDIILNSSFHIRNSEILESSPVILLYGVWKLKIHKIIKKYVTPSSEK